MIRMQQYASEEWFTVKNPDEVWNNIGLFEPLVVETQAEFDYLWSMQLMIGREFVILLKGRDANKTGLPATPIKIDIPL